MKWILEVVKLLLAGIVLFIVAFLVFNTLGCQDIQVMAGGDAESVEDLERSLDGSRVTGLDIRTTNGYIDVKGTVGDQIRMQIHKEVRASTAERAADFAGRVEVQVEQAGSMVRAYVEHPRLPDDVEVEVSFDVECPFAVDLQLNTTNGSLRAEEIEGGIAGTTTNGNIDVLAAQGPFRLNTTNGNIDAELRQLTRDGQFASVNGSIEVSLHSGNGSLRATTTNGSIEVELPAIFSGELDASTVNGRVRSAFQVSGQEGDPPRRMWGTLGMGGSARVELQAVNGNVRVDKL